MFPAIERDVSAIVAESVAWADVRAVVDPLPMPHLEALEFVTVFRGKPIGRNRKSVTFRCRFRGPDRTLQHAEVDQLMAPLLTALRERLGAEIRS